MNYYAWSSDLSQSSDEGKLALMFLKNVSNFTNKKIYCYSNNFNFLYSKKTNLSEKNYLKFITLFIIIIFYSKIFNSKINLVYDLHLLPNTITEKRATFGVKPKFQNLCWVEKNCYIFEDKNLVKTSFFNYKYVK